MTANRDRKSNQRSVTDFSRVSTRHALNEPGARGAPDEPGVFWLFKAGALIFVGHARRSLRARLLAHVRGEEGSCSQRADQYPVGNDQHANGSCANASGGVRSEVRQVAALQ
jgi:hypothetical protein